MVNTLVTVSGLGGMVARKPFKELVTLMICWSIHQLRLTLVYMCCYCCC